MTRLGRGRRWKGGYIRHESDGRKTFIIEREVGGRRFHISTRTHDEDAALEHLVRFEANPLSYDPAGLLPREPVFITVELLADYLAFQLEEKRNTSRHARAMVRFLFAWSEALGPRDLRELNLGDLKRALATWKTSRPHRIIAIKAFFSWLREERQTVKHAEDPTLDLKVPQAEPEKHKRRKAVDWDVVQGVFARLPERYRDFLQLAGATGWHVSELERFCRDERSSIEKPLARVLTPEGREVLAVLRTWHKGKKWTRTSLVHREHLEAAQRLRAAGEFPRQTRLREAMYAAVDELNEERRRKRLEPAPKFGLGVMRHSVATWGVQLGASMERVAGHLEHADPRTTERFYADVAVPAGSVPTRVLRLRRRTRARRRA